MLYQTKDIDRSQFIDNEVQILSKIQSELSDFVVELKGIFKITEEVAKKAGFKTILVKIILLYITSIPQFFLKYIIFYEKNIQYIYIFK